MRVRNDARNALALYGREDAEPSEYYMGDSSSLEQAAHANGYEMNRDVLIRLEYHCHAEYATPPHACYAYVTLRERYASRGDLRVSAR